MALHARPSVVTPKYRRVRSQAALVRALLDDLESSVSLSAAESPFDSDCEQQLIDEVAALAGRLLECVAAMSLSKCELSPVTVRNSQTWPAELEDPSTASLLELESAHSKRAIGA